jgi:glucosyl-dolichyl phosphate glucuronosyltransferase
MSSITVSVVLSTRNRCELLRGALDALMRQTADPAVYEIVVVDNNSSDETRGVVHEYVRHSTAAMKYVHETREGVSYGRNAGIAAARGTAIGFTDDDVRVAPDWVVSASEFVREHKTVQYVGGPVQPIWSAPVPDWLTRRHWSPLAIVDYGDAPFMVPDDRAVCLITANLFVRRTALDRVGWFAPEFRRCQDRELMLRLWRARLPGAYNPSLAAEAVVPPERLQRDFHRRWHTSHGEFLARMPLRGRNIDGRVMVEPSATGRRFRGAPLYEYRALLEHVSRWTLLMAQGRREEAFAQELHARYSAAFLRSAMKHRAPVVPIERSPTLP